MISRSELKQTLREDLSRFEAGKPGLKDWLLRNECWYVWRYIRLLRLVEYWQDCRGLCRIPYLWYFLRYKRLGFKLHLTVYPGTVGGGFRIYHLGGFTHVGPNVKIGKRCTMQPGVVFGNKSEQEDDRQVVVGDNCYFGLDARILGPVTIGNNVTVGANSVVTGDLPDNAVAAGVPAKIIKYKEA